jgi:hypothetical protein
LICEDKWHDSPKQRHGSFIKKFAEDAMQIIHGRVKAAESAVQNHFDLKRRKESDKLFFKYPISVPYPLQHCKMSN